MSLRLLRLRQRTLVTVKSDWSFTRSDVIARNPRGRRGAKWPREHKLYRDHRNRAIQIQIGEIIYKLHFNLSTHPTRVGDLESLHRRPHELLKEIQWVTKVMSPSSIRNTWKQGSWLLWLTVHFQYEKKRKKGGVRPEILHKIEATFPKTTIYTNHFLWTQKMIKYQNKWSPFINHRKWA